LPWRTWQRSADYYPQGALIWLDADMLIRERSQGKQDRYRAVDLDYQVGLRFPHLERDPSVPARFDDLLSAK
jgi:hypothetical protein